MTNFEWLRERLKKQRDADVTRAYETGKRDGEAVSRVEIERLKADIKNLLAHNRRCEEENKRLTAERDALANWQRNALKEIERLTAVAEAAKELLACIDYNPGGYDFRPYYTLRRSSQLCDSDGAVIRLRRALEGTL